MTTPVVAFFNNKGGVGKTSLVYHVAWMYADAGLRVVAADLDPQANLTAAFIDEDRLEQLWEDQRQSKTVFGSIQPLMKGIGDINDPHLEKLNEELAVLVGDLSLSNFEDELSAQWPLCLEGKERAFRVISAFWRIIQKAAKRQKADVVLMDLGPNLGAINRSALISADYVVVPLSPDLFSLQGLRNLGPTLARWRAEWKERIEKNPASDLQLPEGSMGPLGYVVLQHSVRLDRPVKAFDRWIARIPDTYRTAVLSKPSRENVTVETDKACLALLKHYRSLMPMAQEGRKPMFFLKPADGAIGSHVQAVQGAYRDFHRLAGRIANPVGLTFPEET